MIENILIRKVVKEIIVKIGIVERKEKEMKKKMNIKRNGKIEGKELRKEEKRNIEKDWR